MNKIALALATSVTIFSITTPILACESHQAFFEKLKALCGNKYQGEVVESISTDATWREAVIIMDVAECSSNRISIPLRVGENTSRTWIISRTSQHLTLKHDHRHEDGTPDEVTMYGGSSLATGTDYRQEFPADAYSKELFLNNGLDVSVNNTWILMFDGETFSYRLQRPGRTFQVDFDVSEPLE